MTIRVAAFDELREGEVKRFALGPQPALLTRQNGELKAFINRCTHMGGPLRCVEQAGKTILRCEWHEAEFDACSGEAIHGQAPAGSFLQAVPLEKREDGYYATWTKPVDPFDF